MKKTNRWKHVSPKKMSTRERGVFVDKKPCSLGLEFSKAGCCAFTNDVVCSSGFTNKCFECSTYKRTMAEMEEEDIKIDAEIEEIHRTGVWK